MKIKIAYRYSLLITIFGLGASIFALAIFHIGSPDWLFLVVPLMLGIVMPSTFLRGLMQPPTSQKGIKVSTVASIIFVVSVLLMGVVLIAQGANLLQALVFLGIIVVFGLLGLWLIFQVSQQS